MEARDSNADHPSFDAFRRSDDPEYFELSARVMREVESYVRQRWGTVALTSTLEPEDIIQEVFLRAQKSTQFQSENFDNRGEGSFRAFLRDVADSVIHDELRKQGALKRGSHHTIVSLDPKTDADGSAVHVGEGGSPRLDRRDEPTPTSVARQKDLSEQILRYLTGVDREIWLLKHESGLSDAEIGTRLGTTDSAVRSRYHRVVLDLRAKFDDLTPD
jgi:RNA polymerase sigma factor (sigma-70 family)